MSCSPSAESGRWGSTRSSSAPASRSRRFTGTSPPRTSSCSPSCSFANNAGPRTSSKPALSAAALTPSNGCSRSSTCSMSGFTAKTSRRASLSTSSSSWAPTPRRGRERLAPRADPLVRAASRPEEAGLRDTESLAHSFHILMTGLDHRRKRGRHPRRAARQVDGPSAHRPRPLGGQHVGTSSYMSREPGARYAACSRARTPFPAIQSRQFEGEHMSDDPAGSRSGTWPTGMARRL